jgi:hypothetical protein
VYYIKCKNSLFIILKIKKISAVAYLFYSNYLKINKLFHRFFQPCFSCCHEIWHSFNRVYFTAACAIIEGCKVAKTTPPLCIPQEGIEQGFNLSALIFSLSALVLKPSNPQPFTSPSA